MKLYFKILAIVAAVALLPLQYVLLLKVYNSLEKNLYTTVDECFRNAVEQESMARFNRIMDTSQAFAGQTYLNTGMLVGVNDFLQARGSSVNIDTLRSLFAENLADKELQSLSFNVLETRNDTNFYHTADDFLSDPTMEKTSFSSLTTHIVPTSSDLSKGVVAEISNPYRAILPSLKMLIIFSMLIALFVIWCLYKMIRTLGKVNFINNLRKDHTYAMIHDMKTPLSSIMIIAEDFKDNPAIASNPETAEQLKILDDECAHLNRICEKVINVAKVDNKKLKFVYEKIDLEEFFSGIKNRLMALYPEPGDSESKDAKKAVSFSADLSQEKWLIADRLYLTEIVDNLIDNSIKYSGREVKINLRSVRRGKITELRLKDDGSGFSQEASKRLFKKFERGENTVGISGHGIGLNYVYQLMKFFGGYVKIDSQIGLFTEVILGFPSKRQFEIEE
ncbi:MAG: HAMP domain-containing histidine kinase [Bacteroidales bacterium]|nr:HAMP domain-containing histidine kinase [Bacteroidales bacterium]